MPQTRINASNNSMQHINGSGNCRPNLSHFSIYFGKVANRRNEQNSNLIDLNLDYIEKYYKIENFMQKQVHRHLVTGAQYYTTHHKWRRNQQGWKDRSNRSARSEQYSILFDL